MTLSPDAQDPTRPGHADGLGTPPADMPDFMAPGSMAPGVTVQAAVAPHQSSSQEALPQQAVSPQAVPPGVVAQQGTSQQAVLPHVMPPQPMPAVPQGWPPAPAPAWAPPTVGPQTAPGPGPWTGPWPAPGAPASWAPVDAPNPTWAAPPLSPPLPGAPAAPGPQSAAGPSTRVPVGVLLTRGARHCLSPLVALAASYAVALALWFLAIMGLGMTVIGTRASSTSGTSSSASDNARIGAMLLTAPMQLVGMALGGSVHGRAATSLGALDLRITACPVVILATYVLACRHFALARGRRHPVSTHREALVASALAGLVAGAALPLACLVFGVHLSTRSGGSALVAATPRLAVQAWLVSFLVVLVSLLNTSRGLRPRPLVDLALRLVGVIARFLAALAGAASLAAIVVAIALGAHHGAVYVIGTLLMGLFGFGNAALAGASVALGGRVDAQLAYPFLHVTHLAPGAPTWLAWSMCLLATLVACGFAGRRWRALRPGRGVRLGGLDVPSWLAVPTSFLVLGGCVQLLLTASMTLAAGRGNALSGMVRTSPRSLLAWLAAGVLVELVARFAPRRGGSA